MIVHPERTLLTEQDLHLFNEGTHRRLYERLGGRLVSLGADTEGAHFAVWAPNAEAVSVVGDFNDWRVDDAPLDALGSSGIWAGLDERARAGHRYKFHIRSRHGGYSVAKADPFALSAETPPATASVLSRLDHDWGDAEWMARRARHNAADAPISIYEVHLGSWRRPDDPAREFLSYREMADPLAEYATELGFTHVELLPVMEHPFYGSWGYQTTGYFAPSSRYGSPQDFMYLIDRLHQAGVGVILDWVPSHFPTDEHGLVFFDGTHLFEHADPKEGIHPDWDSAIFNYGRNEVRGFLLSSALFWLDVYHVDGLRVDAVASMLYRDYSRAAGEWIPNEYGGRENLEAMSFLRSFNEVVYAEHPDVQTFAEESTAWPMVSRPTWLGGLGFGLKWDMGWMHDTLRYFARDPVHRAHHHGELSFRMMYAFNENFTLPLSHDEVVHGKGSLLGKMPGDEWQRRANLRTLLGYMYAQPGKKLLFMGAELGQEREWNHDAQLQWDLLEDAGHRGLQRWVADLNRVYREQPALHVHDFDPEGFQWLEVHDSARSVYAFLRHGGGASVLVVINATPTPHENYRVGVPGAGTFRELLNSDATHYGGSGWGNLGTVESTPVPHHGLWHSLVLTLPPLSIVLLTQDDKVSAA